VRKRKWHRIIYIIISKAHAEWYCCCNWISLSHHNTLTSHRPVDALTNQHRLSGFRLSQLVLMLYRHGHLKKFLARCCFLAQAQFGVL
jgi:hypothetical protein